MKKTLTLAIVSLVACQFSFAQNITNPKIESIATENNKLIKIETDKQNTIVSFEYTAAGPGSWARIGKEIFLKTPDGKHYNFVKAENITVAPEQTKFENAGDKLAYKIYFAKLPASTKQIDIIEKEDAEDGEAFFNYHNVSLTEVAPPKPTIIKAINNDVVIDEPVANTRGSEIFGALNAMGPMVSNMAKSALDAQLEYYKQPGKLAEVAKLNKQYYDELIKAGFDKDQALKIITADGLMPKMSGGK